MAKLTAEMKEAFGKMKIFPVATASKDGTPNVVPIGVVELVSDDTIWITDNFMHKSLENLAA
ncbi:MAG: pyridoxamine 5'-phosphate oxidase family protein, partial [Methanoregula sp.]